MKTKTSKIVYELLAETLDSRQQVKKNKIGKRSLGTTVTLVYHDYPSVDDDEIRWALNSAKDIIRSLGSKILRIKKVDEVNALFHLDKMPKFPTNLPIVEENAAPWWLVVGGHSFGHGDSYALDWDQYPDGDPDLLLVGIMTRGEFENHLLGINI